ncbi:R-spondin-3-like isoform X1 [Seriola aureovittata]|uniref:R-spondin-3-like isoform X1 n=1 Tax=Seriola aureovittata TaxID=2871759 RepID=UPI0024BD6B66|nr:R-spondin-3-like isoform X1 [Seriola aureovittata]
MEHGVFRLYKHRKNIKLTQCCCSQTPTHTHTQLLTTYLSLTHITGSSSVSRLCPAGCASCSALNGCLSCKPRLFFHLELDGIRQRGTCLSSCPQGHYGMRSPQVNTCTRCKEDCAFCFSDNFCTRCHQGHFLLRGKCDNSCPNGLTANTALRECTECPVGCEVCVRRNVCVKCRADFYFLHGQCHPTCPSGSEPDVQLMQCIPQVHCEVGEWTEWGPCIRKRRMQAYRRGEETRTRQVLQPPSVFGDPCPHVAEFRRCVIKMRQSPSRL